MPRGRTTSSKTRVQEESQVIILDSHGSQFVPEEDRSSVESASSEQQAEEGEEKQKRENTLSILTKRFMSLIKSKENFVLDINEATRQLGVQKRRIYDITNVLQGIGYIQKIHKNKMKWIGGAMDTEASRQIASFDQQIQNCLQQSRLIEESITFLAHKLRKEAEDKPDLNYFIEEDLQDIFTTVAGQPDSMLVFSAPEGSQLKLVANSIAIQLKDHKTTEMTVTHLQKSGRKNSFSILK